MRKKIYVLLLSQKDLNKNEYVEYKQFYDKSTNDKQPLDNDK